MATLARRIVTIGSYAALALLVAATAPLLFGLAALRDRRRGDRRWPTLRGLTFVALYLGCELLGVLASGVLWVALAGGRVGRRDTPAARLTGLADRYLAANFRLQRWWARTLYRGAARVFALRTVVDGDAAVRTGPFILLSRHASIGDTILPAVCIADRHGIMLRYVMKHELRWDPCLDIVGGRLPNAFVRRGTPDGAREVAALQGLLAHLGSHDAVLIYPEGTRVSPAKRARALARLREVAAPPLLAIAARLRHTLPPRLAGTLGLLDANPGADVVLCAHTGFEGAATFRDLFDGTLIGRTVRVAFWRVPCAALPREPAARAEWLYAQWLRIDTWIAAASGEAECAGAAPDTGAAAVAGGVGR